MIGDSAEDYKAAEAYKLSFIFVKNKYNSDLIKKYESNNLTHHLNYFNLLNETLWSSLWLYEKRIVEEVSEKGITFINNNDLPSSYDFIEYQFIRNLNSYFSEQGNFKQSIKLKSLFKLPT